MSTILQLGGPSAKHYVTQTKNIHSRQFDNRFSDWASEQFGEIIDVNEISEKVEKSARSYTQLESQIKQNDELRSKLQILRELQVNNIAYKRLARYSSMFMAFFSIAFLARIFLNITVVTPFWNNIGLFLSFGFLLMALALRKDWKNEV